MEKFRAEMRGMGGGYGLVISVYYPRLCDISMVGADGKAVASTSASPAELEALILALQGAQAMLRGNAA